jgi:hypothetical protein
MIATIKFVTLAALVFITAIYGVFWMLAVLYGTRKDAASAKRRKAANGALATLWAAWLGFAILG